MFIFFAMLMTVSSKIVAFFGGVVVIKKMKKSSGYIEWLPKKTHIKNKQIILKTFTIGKKDICKIISIPTPEYYAL